ncbi:MAG: HAMP domain-containing histidine kinase [Lachnospiraceae bacterium]|nr:HAMP domain-containing histidine kinase [Lachnospiraceae bacterium]
MKLFRNPEFRIEWILIAVLTAAASVIGFYFHPAAGSVPLALGVAVLLIFFLTERIRYRRIAALSDRIDRILHDQEQMLISEGNEGELSILTDEIGKMTVRLRDQAEELRREKTRLTEVIQDIFHQIRTPLTSIHVTLSLLEEESLSYEDRLRLTRNVKRQTERIHSQVEALLKMSKIDSGTAGFVRETVRIRDVVDRAWEPLKIPYELKGIAFRNSVADETVQGDPFWTTEAIGNLLKNALEHNHSGGTVTMTATENPLYTELIIEDDGEGFRPEDLPHLFERFYKGANASEESIGIGLALTRMIITEENGTIKAETKPEGGARFTIRFYKSVV